MFAANSDSFSLPTFAFTCAKRLCTYVQTFACIPHSFSTNVRIKCGMELALAQRDISKSMVNSICKGFTRYVSITLAIFSSTRSFNTATLSLSSALFVLSKCVTRSTVFHNPTTKFVIMVSPGSLPRSTTSAVRVAFAF